MKMKKGDRFQATYSDQNYEIVGKWCGDLVLAPATPGDEECLIYSAGEIEELLETGKFVREGGRK